MSNRGFHDISIYHERTRTRGVQPVVYWTSRAILVPLLRLVFWLGRIGREHVPDEGAVLLAANHRSSLDPFLIGCCVKRPMYFMAKRELFNNRLFGWYLNCLGAFPVRRGESDEEALATAAAVLERGDPLTIFPEGKRFPAGALRRPRRGVGRLALETGAPVVPVAVAGTERARDGWRINPCRVRIRIGRPLTFPRVERPSQHLASEVTGRIWPCVELQWEWLGGLPPLRRAAVIGAGSMGSALAVLLARGGLEVQLGARTAAQAELLAAERQNARYLPGVELPPEVSVSTVEEIELAGVDLVVLAVPSSALPAAVARSGAGIGQRSAVLVASKGLVGPLGTTPSRYVGERVRARAVAVLGGPVHALEAVRSGAAAVLASDDLDFQIQLGDVLEAAGTDIERSDDLVGTELAGAAKNAAALAAAAAAGEGMNAAGAAAGRVFCEVHELALREGARGETFAGLAGAGDLVSTVLAAGSRNRRAGEELANGVPAEQIPGVLGQAAEALDCVPLLAQRLESAGLEASALGRLRDLVEGRLAASDWVAGLGTGTGERTRADRETRAA